MNINKMHAAFFSIIFIGLVSNKNYANHPMNKEIKEGNHSIVFHAACHSHQGKVYNPTIKNIYAISMKNASQLNVEFNEYLEENYNSFPVYTLSNNDLEDNIASEQTEKLLTLAYLNKMEIDVCIIPSDIGRSIFSVRLK